MKSISKTIYDVIIIGAGASGMMAAITAARNGARVLILEHKDKIGKKILATGNGKCNYTNSDMSLEKFCGNHDLLTNILKEFSFKDSIQFFSQLGIYPKNKNGYYYPNSEQAQSIVNAFDLELQRLNIKVILSETIKDIDKSNGFFLIYTDQNTFSSRKLIVATGLLANPKLGSDGSLFNIIKNLGHRFTPIVPALCGFYCKGIDFKKCAGVRTEGSVSAVVNNKIVACDRGEIQLTDYGVSGIPVFQISRYLSYGLYNKQNCKIIINFFPTLSKEQLFDFLLHRRDNILTDVCALDYMNGFINSKLAKAILSYCNISYDLKVQKLAASDISLLTEALHSTKITVDKWRDFEFAQICAGGIRTEEIDIHTLESKLVKGLFFAGEILDVDGICGGYNLQWAWSSGFVAGNNI